MALTLDDKEYIQETVRDTVIEALEQIILPRFDEHDAKFAAQDVRFDQQDENIKQIKNDILIINQDVFAIKNDILEIKHDVRSLDTTAKEMNGRLTALESDVKEIYKILAKSQYGDEAYSELKLEMKLLKLHEELHAAAKLAGITLPR